MEDLTQAEIINKALAHYLEQNGAVTVTFGPDGEYSREFENLDAAMSAGFQNWEQYLKENGISNDVLLNGASYSHESLGEVLSMGLGEAIINSHGFYVKMDPETGEMTGGMMSTKIGFARPNPDSEPTKPSNGGNQQDNWPVSEDIGWPDIEDTGFPLVLPEPEINQQGWIISEIQAIIDGHVAEPGSVISEILDDLQAVVNEHNMPTLYPATEPSYFRGVGDAEKTMGSSPESGALSNAMAKAKLSATPMDNPELDAEQKVEPRTPQVAHHPGL